MNRSNTTLVILAFLMSQAAPLTATERTSDDATTPTHSVTLGLGGYSPVSYIESGRAQPGSPSISALHDGITYFFTSEHQRKQFRSNPERYLPAYGGYCAFGCSVNARFVPDPTQFKIVDGRTHLFLKTSDIDALKLWNDADPTQIKDKADRYWATQTQSKAYLNSLNLPASGIAVDGYSPVSYFANGVAEKGDPRFSVEHGGATYHLTSEEQVKMFKAAPERYIPQFGGWCALGMAVSDKFPVDPTKFKIVDGKLYLFLNNANVDALELWNQGKERDLIEKAQTYWKKISS